MYKYVVTIYLAGLVALSLPASAADIGVGKVLAFDREAGRLVLTDRTVWDLTGSDSVTLEKLSAGDRVQFSYRSGDDGIGEIIELNVMRERTADGVRVSESGTVLAYDRSAELLILDDKSAWSLQNMQNSLPIGISAGDRVRIEYGTDEGGTRRVHEVRVITF